MIVDVKQNGRNLIFTFVFEKTDAKIISREERSNYGLPQEPPKISPAKVGNEHKFFLSYQESCSVQMPNGWNIKDLHPDVLGLAIVFLVFPFVKKQIKLSFGVSEYFATQVKSITGRELLPVDHKISKREYPKSGNPILLYSGGVDSTAALALLPSNTALVYSKRKSRIDDVKDKTFSAESAVNACNYLKNKYKDVFTIENDIEYLLKPTSLTTHQTISVPALLLADFLNSDCLAFGTVMEAAYRIGSGGFVDVSKRNFYQKIKLLYDSVGLAYHPVTIGMTEVCTTKLCESTGFAHLAESCTRSKGGKPCLVCIKCFRKRLLNMAINGEFASDEELEKFFELPLIKKVLMEKELKLENVYAYICSKYKGNSVLMKRFKERVLPKGRTVEWQTKWYKPSLDHIAEKYRDYCESKANEILEPMTEKDIEAMFSFFKIKTSQSIINEFQNLLQTIKPEGKRKKVEQSKISPLKIDEAYRFNKECLELVSEENVNFSTNLTVDLYLNIHSYPNDWTGIISKYEDDFNNEFCLRLRDQNNGRWHFFNGEKNVGLKWDPKSILPLNTWVRLTAVRNFNEGVLKLYANEILVSKKNFSNIGKAKQVNKNILVFSQGKRTLDASLAQVRIWNRALSHNDLLSTQIMDDGYKQDSDLVCYLKLLSKNQIINFSKNKIKYTLHK